MSFPPLPPIHRSPLEALPPAIPKLQKGAKLPSVSVTSAEAHDRLTSLSASFTTNSPSNREVEDPFSTKSTGTIHLVRITEQKNRASILSNPGKIRRSRVPSFFIENSSSRSPSTASPSSLGSELDDL